MSNIQYMNHVAGLRGLAIALVVWFHITLNNSAITDLVRLPHGYFGVDVFLVIMGYFLIKGFRYKDDLRLFSFLTGKVKRILFPVSIVVFFTLLASCLLCSYTAKSMAYTGLMAVIGGANIWLSKATEGYFAADTSSNPFMHTWYIGVAMQVYVIFIIGLLCLKRLSCKWRWFFCCLVAFCSLVYHFADVIKDVIMQMGGGEIWYGSIVSYYSTLPRLWEVLAGGLVLFMPDFKNKKLGTLLFCCGLAAILIPSLSRGEEALFLTPVVVIGTLLVIKYGETAWGQKLLGNFVITNIGKISFSLYLLHMPIFVFYKIWNFHEPDTFEAIGLLLASLLAAYVFYIAIEKKQFPLWLVILVIGVSSSFCFAVHKNASFLKYFGKQEVVYSLPANGSYQMSEDESLYNGFDKKALEPYENWHSLLNNGNVTNAPVRDSSFILLGPPHKKAEFVIVGDSHAIHVCPGMDKICNELGISGVCLNTVIMPLWNRMLRYYGKGMYYNAERAEALLNWLKVQQEIKYVIVGIHWDYRFKRIRRDWSGKITLGQPVKENLEALKEFCKQMQLAGKHVIVFYPEPYFNQSNITEYAKWLISHNYPLDAIHSEYIYTEEEYNATYSQLISRLEQLEQQNYLSMLDIRPAFFKDGDFKAIRNGVQLYIDGNHFSIEGSIEFMKSIKDSIHKIMRSEKYSMPHISG